MSRPKLSFLSYYIFHYSRADREGPCFSLDNHESTLLSMSPNVEFTSMWFYLSAKSLQKFDSYHRYRFTLPWFTPEIRHLIKCVRSLRRKIMFFSIMNQHYYLRHSMLSLPVFYGLIHQQIFTKALVNFDSGLVNSFKSDLKQLNRFIRQLSSMSQIPKSITHNSISTYHHFVKVNMFNSFFNSVFIPRNFVLNHLPTLVYQHLYSSTNNSSPRHLVLTPVNVYNQNECSSPSCTSLNLTISCTWSNLTKKNPPKSHTRKLV